LARRIDVMNHALGRLVPRGIRMLEEREQTLTLKLTGRRSSAKFGQRGINVDQFNCSRACLSLFIAWRGNDQRHAASEIEHSELRPQSFMIAQVIAVITEEDDDCVVPKLLSIENVQQNADLCIHESNTSIVGGHRLGP